MRGRPPKSPVIPSRKIWVDADTCPPNIMDVLFHMAEARRLILTLVATESQTLPNSAYIRSLVVPPGDGVVSGKIAAMIDQGDLVLTNDAPLAQAAAQKKAAALNASGKSYHDDDGEAPPSVEQFMAAQAAAGHRSLAERLRRKDQQQFAARLDHHLTRAARMVVPVAAPVKATARAPSVTASRATQ